LQLFAEHRSETMTHLLLSHLSKENNSPEIALQLFEPYSGQVKISVASRYEASEVFVIQANNIPLKRNAGKAAQMVLFNN